MHRLRKKMLGKHERAKMKARKYAHDCGCVVAPHFGGTLCQKCYLDGMHSKKHKCKTPAMIYKKQLNSQAAEQFWSRWDKMTMLRTMSRSHFRCFLFHYCRWRNLYNSDSNHLPDANPCLSVRKMTERKGGKAMKRKRGQ